MHIPQEIRTAVHAVQDPTPSTTAQALELAQEAGTLRLAQGVWLSTGEQLAGERPRWGEHDLARGVDFTAHRYWLTTNDGQLAPIDTPEDLAAALKL